MVGSASRSSVGSTGPVKMVERASIALAGTGLAIAAGWLAALPASAGTSSSSPAQASPDGAGFCRLIGLFPGRLRALASAASM
jgi:hypothetical protein